jgi:hypothetical protein
MQRRLRKRIPQSLKSNVRIEARVCDHAVEDYKALAEAYSVLHGVGHSVGSCNKL